MRDEIIESYGHLKQAAAHAAGASAERITPPYDKARDAASKGWVSTKDAFAPLYETMREGTRNARAKERRVTQRNRTWPVLFGFLAAGAAIGAAGAMIARRRRLANQWEEYNPSEDTFDEAAASAKHAAESGAAKVSAATKKVTAGAAAVADTVSAQAGKLAGSLHEKAGTPSRAADAAGDLVDKAKEGAESFAAYANETADDLVARAEQRH